LTYLELYKREPKIARLPWIVFSNWLGGGIWIDDEEFYIPYIPNNSR